MIIVTSPLPLFRLIRLVSTKALYNEQCETRVLIGVADIVIRVQTHEMFKKRKNQISRLLFVVRMKFNYKSIQKIYIYSHQRCTGHQCKAKRRSLEEGKCSANNVHSIEKRILGDPETVSQSILSLRKSTR